jgi:hypothetical protein
MKYLCTSASALPGSFPDRLALCGLQVLHRLAEGHPGRSATLALFSDPAGNMVGLTKG